MKNFTDFLTSMARGQDPDLGEMLKGRRKNGPLPVSLLPSEAAMKDIHEGLGTIPQPGRGLANPVGGERGGEAWVDGLMTPPSDNWAQEEIDKGYQREHPSWTPTYNGTPPPPRTLPSERAGMLNAERLANSPRLETAQPGTGLENPIGGVRGGAPKFNYGGAISGIAGGIADAAKPAPWINNTPNFSDDLAPRQIPRFARGGFLPLNQLGIVGDGSDPNSEEIIQPTAQGVNIQPLAQPGTDLQNPVGGERGGNSEQYGLGQTEATRERVVDMPPAPPAQQNAQPTSPDQPLQPNNRQSPLDAELTQLYSDARHRMNNEKWDSQQNKYVPIKTSKWKDIGSILAQSFNNAVNPNQARPVVPWSESKKEEALRPIIGQIGALEQQRKGQIEALDAQAQRKLRDAQSDYYSGKNDVSKLATEQRALAATQSNLTRQYNALTSYSEDDPDDKAFGDQWEKVFHSRPLEKNAATKSQIMYDQKDGQGYAVQTDKEGHTKVVRLLKDDGTPYVVETKEQLTAEEKKAQRELQKLIADNRNVTSMKVAEINAGGRRDVANINQGGQTGRATTKTSAQAAQVMEAIRLGAPKGSSEQDILNRQQNYWNSLPEEIRKQVNSPNPPTQ